MVSPDFRDLLVALNEAQANYLVVGAHAMAFYAEPRYTKDLDVWVETSPVNAPRVLAALQTFGAPLAGATEGDFAVPGIVLQIGVAPNRIDITTHIDGVTFEAARPNRLSSTFGDQSIWVIGRAELMQNEAAVARPQDLLDLAMLETHG